MRMQGTIVKWDDERGFGFIAAGASRKQIFLHIKAFSSHGKRPEPGAEVSFELAMDGQNRPRAEKARLVGASGAGPAFKAFCIAAVFLALVAAACSYGPLPDFILWMYLGMSVISLIQYSLDKRAARRGGRRTPESTLHLFSLLGGWPGALYARQLLRHKSSKQSFRRMFRITVVLNVCALAYLLSPYGADILTLLNSLGLNLPS